MINAHLSSIAAPHGVEARVHRVGSRGFWMLFAIEGAFIAVALILVLQLLLPARAPLAQSADYALVRDAVWSRLNGAVSDPLVEIAPGVTVRSSGVRGLSLHGQTYYYYLEGQRGFDPLSRGAVDRRDVEVVLRDDGGPETLVIYRLIR